MKTSKETNARDGSERRAGDEIARAAKLAAKAFDDQVLSDSELDDLCDAVLVQDAERRVKLIDKKAWR